jgi:hypothetical protein
MARRLVLSVAALTMVFVSASSAQQYQGNRKIGRELSQKNVRCHAAVDPKGLKGPARKAEWQKCWENPDNYH